MLGARRAPGTPCSPRSRRWTATTARTTPTRAGSSPRATPATTPWSPRATSSAARQPASGSASRPTSAPCSTHPPGATTSPPTSAAPAPCSTSTSREAARALGPDYVILLRGHRFHELPRYGAHVVDVTGYPEINDLILASDAAVLDYSSLRFDFAVTGQADGLPGARPPRLHRAGPRLPLRLRALGPGAVARLHRRGGRRPGRPARASSGSGRAGSRSSTATTTGWPTAGPRERVVAEFFEPLLRD